MLERRGVISGYEGSKPRQVLITEADLPRVLAALGSIPPADWRATSLPATMPEIGATLREARMRARIDVSEIEAKTKIRAKYLRALENEEWDLLPGPTFVKSFLRTYAQALGLDGKALVEEYRLSYEHPSERRSSRSSPARGEHACPRGPGGPGGRRPSRGYHGARGSRRDRDRAADRRTAHRRRRRRIDEQHEHARTTPPPSTRSARPGATAGRQRRSARQRRPRRCRCRCSATGTVYVCLLGRRRAASCPGADAAAGRAARRRSTPGAS